MRMQYLWFGLILSICCLLTAITTRWIVIANVRADVGRAVEFHSYRDAFTEFVHTHQLAHGEEVSGEKLPARLRTIGIVNVYRNGRFVYFVLPPTSIMADDATCEFIYQLESSGGAVEEILRTTRRTTYHIQHLSSAPGWYYWMHN